MVTERRRGLGPEFHKLWGAFALSNLGDGVALVAAPLLAATITHDPTLVAGLSFAQRIPWLLFALFSGAIADRIDRKRAMAYVGLIRAALFGFIGVAVVFRFVSMYLLYFILFTLATAETFFDTASSTIIPKVVEQKELPKANARLAGTMTVTNLFLGKPIGSLLFATAAALPFILGAGGFFAAAILILSLSGSFRADRSPTRQSRVLLAEIRAGLRWLFRHKLLRTIAIVLAILNMMVVAQNAILVLFVQECLGVRPAAFGVLVATYGVGGVLGSLVAERVIRQLGTSTTLRLALIIEATVPAVLALSRSPVLFGAVYVCFGFHAVTWGALLTALRQELTPDELRGRVESVYRLIEYGGAAPGALLGGVLASNFGLRAPFWAGAVVGVIIIPFAWPVFSESAVTCARKAADEKS